MPKNPSLVRNKLEHWNLDELTIVSEGTGQKIAGFSKVLIAVDHFSHFMLVQPVEDNLTEKQVLDFIQTCIIAVFGYPQSISSDNASNMDSSLIKNTCGWLGISKLTSSPYSARSNLSELLNRLVLDSLRNITAGIYSSAAYFSVLLTPVVYLINSICFTDTKYISPYLIVFEKLRIYYLCLKVIAIHLWISLNI